MHKELDGGVHPACTRRAIDARVEGAERVARPLQNGGPTMKTSTRKFAALGALLGLAVASGAALSLHRAASRASGTQSTPRGDEPVAFGAPGQMRAPAIP